MSNTDDLDENAPEFEIANIVNRILLEHREKWNGDDEIQDMVAQAFVEGMKYERENNG